MVVLEYIYEILDMIYEGCDQASKAATLEMWQAYKAVHVCLMTFDDTKDWGQQADVLAALIANWATLFEKIVPAGKGGMYAHILVRENIINLVACFCLFFHVSSSMNAYLGCHSLPPGLTYCRFLAQVRLTGQVFDASIRALALVTQDHSANDGYLGDGPEGLYATPRRAHPAPS